MKPVGLCLIDTGGHYLQGTTDITRTVPLGKLTEEEKKAYTLVLMGHLRLAATVLNMELQAEVLILLQGNLCGNTEWISDTEQGMASDIFLTCMKDHRE